MKKPTSPPSREEIGKLEPYVGLGLESVWVISSAAEAQQALAELRGQEALGFDTESRPTFLKNEQSRGPHVLQFATPQKAYIFQAHRRECHAAITEILESGEIAKIGFGLKDDLKFIADKFGIEPKAIVDLNSTFSEIGYRNQVGARTAIAMLFKKRFLKSKSTTTSDWSARTLSARQVLYAANDAYAAIQVYRALNGRINAGAKP
ncbi:MAG: 3'-5' exonuclease domain-containing protein 2 [Candidatus Latescibacteria bacterium]|nr:3'-5' exonuclease domain-containing protein 2 [Candidatus Latescibacterota bacterium]